MIIFFQLAKENPVKDIRIYRAAGQPKISCVLLRCQSLCISIEIVLFIPLGGIVIR